MGIRTCPPVPRDKGYKVSATNYLCRWGEVIYSQFGEKMVFVEVKTRRGAAFGIPEESVIATKPQRLIATAKTTFRRIAWCKPHGAQTWSALAWMSKENC